MNRLYSHDKVYDHLEVENCVDGSNVRNGHEAGNHDQAQNDNHPGILDNLESPFEGNVAVTNARI